ncbi:MAG: hypothetical protein H8E10_19225 [Desulfobacterales bacterium]|nr:hypothetical protein [Desulfobacterales bacterium]MBU0735454.1 hypothetical protein [Pseudomonadota bacterium]
MIEALFLIIWTALFVMVAWISWVRIVNHWKVYLMMAYNWLYLTGIFLMYPKLHQTVAYLYAYFA